MLKTLTLMMIALFSAVLMQPTASGQTTSPSFVKRGYHYSKWGNQKGWEVVTVSGPGKMIFLSGVGAEDENSTGPTILHLGDFEGQCHYAIDKIKRILAREGASMDDIVKIVAYVTDIRSEADYGECLNEAFGSSGRHTVHTFLNISQLAHPGMLLEIDVTAMVPAKGSSR
ncbi:MAG TPA: RidA family protein [Blastocatellia bacterium]|nr:RidA family protein [Blastocatellia bacterium]